MGKKKEPVRQRNKAPLRPSGILFALAANVLLVTVTDVLLGYLGIATTSNFLLTLGAPALAGMATALYTGQRGGMHAFIGGLISIPILTFLVFGGVWQFGIFAGAFCGLAGSFTELVLRRRRT